MIHGILHNKTARTMIIFVALAVLPYLVPALSGYRVLIPRSVSNFLNIKTGERQSSLEIAQAADSNGADEPPRAGLSSKPGEIEDPSGRALAGFFASLQRTEIDGSQTRICHYGDSPITNDGITSTVRRRTQLKFGDAGHGFILAAKPWGWYRHAGVVQEPGGGWQSDPMFISRGEHLYGLGGVSFSADLAGVTASFATAEEGEVGRSVSSFDIYYLARPGGGDFDIEIDGQFIERVATASDHATSGFRRITVEEGAHRLTIKTAGNGRVQMYGVAMESSRAGVQYDSLGVNGAFIGLLTNYLDGNHWTEQLRRRQPDLVIIGYGANESQFEGLVMDQYERDTREAIQRIRAALPGVSIMLLAPMDRGMKGAGGRIVTRPMILKLIAYQRRIARETGCAFFDTFTAMGGEGTAARWFEARPRLMGGDFTHPTAQGAEIVGTLIYDAIVKSYEDYKAASAKR